MCSTSLPSVPLPCPVPLWSPMPVCMPRWHCFWPSAASVGGIYKLPTFRMLKETLQATSLPKYSFARKLRASRCLFCKGFREMLERSEEHTSELQSHVNLVCRLLLEK